MYDTYLLTYFWLHYYPLLHIIYPIGSTWSTSSVHRATKITCEYDGNDTRHFNEADAADSAAASVVVQWEHPGCSPSSVQHNSVTWQRSASPGLSHVSLTLFSLFLCKASSMLLLMSFGRACSTCTSIWNDQPKHCVIHITLYRTLKDTESIDIRGPICYVWLELMLISRQPAWK